jgi:hypothetical protein
MSDDELARRQDALQAEAAQLLARTGLVDLLETAGEVLLTGSFVSGLMTWREIDIMLLAPGCTPHDVLDLAKRIVDLPTVTGFDYRDERGERRPTEQVRDERYHLGITAGEWQIDLSIWLHDIHANVTEWHEWLRGTITPDQRAAILRIKDAWRREPGYDGGLNVYHAVLEGGVVTPAEFRAWLDTRIAADRARRGRI